MVVPRPDYRIQVEGIEPVPAGVLRDQLYSTEVNTPVLEPLALGQNFLCFRVAGSEPEYPASALRRGIEGQVVIDVATDATGAVSDASVLQSEPVGVFDTAALRAVRRWRYPAAGCERTQVRLRFELPPGAR
jgi:protein TonB